MMSVSTAHAQDMGQPVTLGIDPGQPFPPYQGDRSHQVNSPVGVTVNSKAAVVQNKIGWPGMYDMYRVDFVVPDGITPGMASIQVTAAWIPPPAVNIAVR